MIISKFSRFLKSLVDYFKNPRAENLLFLVFLALSSGTIAYHFLEGWSYLNSLYFCVITLSTIGFGDFSPITTAGKIFTMFYILVGIGIIFNFIHIIAKSSTNLHLERIKALEQIHFSKKEKDRKK
ncbi:MAG: potassium channel family protein [archaeon]